MKIYRIAQPKPKVDWNNVDWSHRNIDITKKLGVPQKSVPYYRKKLSVFP